MRCRQRQFTASVRIMRLSGVSRLPPRAFSRLSSLFSRLHALIAKCRGASLTEHHHKLTSLRRWGPSETLRARHTLSRGTLPPPPPRRLKPNDSFDIARAVCCDIESMIGSVSGCFSINEMMERPDEIVCSGLSRVEYSDFSSEETQDGKEYKGELLSRRR